MKQSDLEDFDGAPLNEVENKKLRKIIRDQERVDWFWATARVWGGWGAAIIGFFYMIREHISKAVKALF